MRLARWFAGLWLTGPQVPEPVSPTDGSSTEDTTPTLQARYLHVAEDGDVTFQIDRVSTFDSPDFQTGTVTGLADGDVAAWTVGTELTGGMWFWRARGSNGAGTSDWTAVQSLTVITPLVRALYQYENVARTNPGVQKRALYQYENVAKAALNAEDRALYQYINTTNDPPFPTIYELSTGQGEVGDTFTITGNGFGFLQGDYGGQVLLGALQCAVLSWGWTQIVAQVPAGATTGLVKVRLGSPTQRDSNAVAFKVLEAVPQAGVGLEFAVSPAGDLASVIAILDGAWGRQFQAVLSDVGAGQFSISRGDPKGGDPNVIKPGNLVRCRMDGVERFAWIIESVRPEYADESHQQVVSVSGRGALALLDYAIVYPESYPLHTSLDRTFSNATGAGILQTLIAEAQARGALSGVTLDFDGTNDSDGLPWPETLPSYTVHAGKTLLEVARELTDAGAFELYMAPGFVLKAFVSRGFDVSAAVTFEPGGSSLSIGRTVDHRHVVNALLAEGDGEILSTVDDTLSQNELGRREAYIMARNIGDAGGLADYAAAALDKLKRAGDAIQVSVDSAPYVPFVDYDLGDTVRVYVPPTDVDPNGLDTQVRVRAITVEDAADAGITVSLDINTLVAEREIAAQRRLDRLSNNSIGATLFSDSFAQSATKAELSAHNHDAKYSQLGHDHDTEYAPVTHGHSLAIQDLNNVDVTGLANGDVLKYDAGASLWKPATDESGSGSNTLLDLLTNQRPGQLGGYSAFPGGNTQLADWGVLEGMGKVQNTSTAVADENGIAFRQATSSTANTDARSHQGSARYQRRYNPALLVKAALGLDSGDANAANNIRAFIGFTGNVVNVNSADDPATPLVGVQFSTARGDSTWQFVSHDGTTMNRVASSVTPSANAIFVKVAMDDGMPSATVEIRDASFTLLDAHTFTTNLPASTAGHYIFSGIRNLTAAFRYIRQYYGHLVLQV